MGRYWDHEGPQQAAYDRLNGELVPASGPAETLEGEMLRAAGKLGYEAYNNGFGNNVSGALRFLQRHFPDFRREWTDVLSPLVTGNGVCHASEASYAACEEIVDAVTGHVLSRDGAYSESPCDMHSLRVEMTGDEIEFPDEDDFEDEDEDELTF